MNTAKSLDHHEALYAEARACCVGLTEPSSFQPPPSAGSESLKLPPTARSNVVLPLSRAEREEIEWIGPIIERLRPRTRTDCIDGNRPCPFVGCRHNTYILGAGKRTVKLTHPEREPWDVPPDESCVLDVVDNVLAHGGEGLTLEAVAEILGVERERIRQIEEEGIAHVRDALRLQIGVST